MAIVNDDELEAIASFIVNNEVNGNCACCAVLDSMPEEMQKEVNAPCKSSNYDDEWCYDCPFWSKDAFLYWIEKSNNGLKIREIKRPRREDFLTDIAEYLTNDDTTPIEYPNYAEALERYCNELEKALDNACEYIHDCGSNGCPNNYDGKEMKECKMCNYECMSLDDELNSSKSQYDEYLKKSIKCWKEYFLKGEQ